MGRRDYRHRESKKPKKDEKKAPASTPIIQPPRTVEVIKKGKKEGGEE